MLFSVLYHDVASIAATKRGSCIAAPDAMIYLTIMPSLIRYNNLHFLTGTIHQWKSLLASDQNKQIILDSFSFLVDEKRMVIYSFVILDNHYHLLFEVIPPHTKSRILNSMHVFTSRKLIANISDADKFRFKVERSNKKIQIWKPNSLCIEIITEKFLRQKFNYIHKNVERAGLNPDTYPYSSWPSYVKGVPQFDFLTLWG